MSQEFGTVRIPPFKLFSSGTIDPPAPSALPGAMLMALLHRTGGSVDGDIVEVLQPAWHALLALIRNDPSAMHALSPRQFEELLAATYSKAGYDEVVLTPRSADQGRDVIAIKRGWGSVRIIDQAKCFKPGHLVTANDVRALLGVLHSDLGATKGIVTTTSAFAPRIRSDPLIQPHLPYRLELVDGAELKDRLATLEGRD